MLLIVIFGSFELPRILVALGVVGIVVSAGVRVWVDEQQDADGESTHGNDDETEPDVTADQNGR